MHASWLPGPTAYDRVRTCEIAYAFMRVPTPTQHINACFRTHTPMCSTHFRPRPPPPQALQRALNARQFGLKLIANVTYGYTSASFSGRMPMAELADSIVQVG